MYYYVQDMKRDLKELLDIARRGQNLDERILSEVYLNILFVRYKKHLYVLNDYDTNVNNPMCNVQFTNVNTL